MASDAPPPSVPEPPASAPRAVPAPLHAKRSGPPLPGSSAEDAHSDEVACPDCGLVQTLVMPGRLQVAECARCRRTLAGRATGRIATPLAFACAALVLMVPAVTLPLMTVSTLGAFRQSWLPSSATAMWRDGYVSLSLLVGVFTLALPFVFLALLIWALINLELAGGRHVAAAFRWSRRLRPWVMVEVYLVGGFVAYSRIKVVANVDVEVGGWCLVAAALALLLAMTQLDERTVWERLRPQGASRPGTATFGCTVCEQVVAEACIGEPCPRCGAIVHARKPHSLQYTTALVLAGYVLYIPANTLPVLTTVRLGREEHNTILSGVLELIRNDLWPLAVIVFAASIVLPLLKLSGLTWMLLTVRSGSSSLILERTRLFRMIDTVGRWSNIDVFAVSVLLAMLQFGALTAVHAGNGLIAFAAVVILTMLATTAFDSRLMWDACGRANG